MCRISTLTTLMTAMTTPQVSRAESAESLVPSGDTREDAVWGPDKLPGFSAREFILPVVPEPSENGAPLRTTLVRYDDSGHKRAVLYVHGWNDYFFHTHVAEHFAERGYAFYALDLRRYGRSLDPQHLAGYITDLDDYEIEFDLAASAILAEHDSLTVIAHSTGGLSAALWVDRNPGVVSALILNSPWLEMHGSWLVRSLAKPLVSQVSGRAPTSVLPLPAVNHYATSLHAKYGGEWNYDLEWKAEAPVPIRVGWINAVLSGQERVATGLHIDCPVLVLTSTRSLFRPRWHPSMRQADTVLDVTQILARAVLLGDVVTTVRIPGAMHDVTLSEQPARARLWTELDRWLAGYGPRG